MKTKVFYHRIDLDGQCAGASVAHLIGWDRVELIGIDYGEPFPWDSVIRGEEVWMVDFSLQPFAEMERLERDYSLFWIDHHKSAIEARDASGILFSGIQEVGTGACALVWRYFDRPLLPEAVRLLAEYDVWNHTDPRTLPFQYGMRLEDTRADNQAFWERVFAMDALDIAEIVDRGATVQRYVKQENEKAVAAAAFETEVFNPGDGGPRCYRGIALNQVFGSSQVFDSVWDPEKYDLMLVFGWRRDQWVVSLYSDKPDVDCSAVATYYGGGGHKGAAGFSCVDLPFVLPVRDEA